MLSAVGDAEISSGILEPVCTSSQEPIVRNLPNSTFSYITLIGEIGNGKSNFYHGNQQTWQILAFLVLRNPELFQP